MLFRSDMAVVVVVVLQVILVLAQEVTRLLIQHLMVVVIEVNLETHQLEVVEVEVIMNGQVQMVVQVS